MRKMILTTAASAAITAALCFATVGGAEAMTPGSASGVRAAVAATNLSESIACRWYHGRRVCRGPAYYGGYGPGYYGGYPGYYGGYPGYYGGYGPGVGIYGPGVGIGIGVGPRWGW